MNGSVVSHTISVTCTHTHPHHSEGTITGGGTAAHITNPRVQCVRVRYTYVHMYECTVQSYNISAHSRHVDSSCCPTGSKGNNTFVWSNCRSLHVVYASVLSIGRQFETGSELRCFQDRKVGNCATVGPTVNMYVYAYTRICSKASLIRMCKISNLHPQIPSRSIQSQVCW